jgi:hypothetical protein
MSRQTIVIFSDGAEPQPIDAVSDTSFVSYEKNLNTGIVVSISTDELKHPDGMCVTKFNVEPNNLPADRVLISWASKVKD